MSTNAAKQNEKIHLRRIIGLIIGAIILLLLGATRLFDYQVVETEKYSALAQKSSYTTVKIEAARGEIVDRNGVPLTRNMASFHVELDYAFLKRGEENKVINSLIKTFEALNESYIDELPITKTKPYEFLPDRGDDISRLKRNVGVNSYATAQDCMYALYERNDSRYEKDEQYEGISGVEYLPYTEEYKRKIAGVRYQMILRSFSTNNPRYTFSDSIKPATVAFLREMSADFVGVEVTEKASRTYVNGEVASHLMGKIGLMNEQQLQHYLGLEGGDYAMNDTVGQGGVEEAFEELLRGKNGQMKVIKNSKGEVVDVIETIEPEAGKTISLTVDYYLNKRINEIFADFIKNFNETNKDDKFAEAGAVVLLDTKTGGVLASTSYPYYDQQEYFTNYSAVATKENDPLFNRALQGLYRPGSTFKPVVAAASLAENIITPQSEIYCAVHYKLSDMTFNCLGTNHAFSNVDVVTALEWSCNYFFYETGTTLGIRRMEDYAHLMGLGADTGLEIPNKTGNISSPEYSEKHGAIWTPGDVVQTAIGQLDTQVTPLQMAIEAMTVANNGVRYDARLLKEVYNHDRTKLLEPEKKTIASSFTMPGDSFKSVVDGMVAAGLTIGAPYNLNDLGYRVAVKTGTPQVTVEKTNNTFIAFAPADAPEIAISCMLEDGLNTNRMIKDILKAYEQAKANPGKPIEGASTSSTSSTSSTTSTSASSTTSSASSTSSSSTSSSEAVSSDDTQ